MRKLLLLVSLFPAIAFADAPPCPKPGPEEEPVYGNEFAQQVSPEELAANFQALYNNPKKRLRGRAYLDARSKSYVFEMEEGLVRIDPLFLRAVTRHVEIALERRYADFVYFPDMGHSHFFIPKKDWQERVAPVAGNRRDLYETMIKQRSLRMLYHTAEQLKVKEGAEGAFPQDRALLWRYFSRNVVGDNENGENVYPLFFWGDIPKYNTLDEIGASYHKHSAGFYISSSRNGCFPYRRNGKTLYFDLSLEEMPYKDTGGGFY